MASGYLFDPGMRSNGAGAAIGTAAKTRAPIVRARGAGSGIRYRGLGTGGRPPGRSDGVRVRAPGTSARPGKRVRGRESAEARRAACRFGPIMPAQPWMEWKGRAAPESRGSPPAGNPVPRTAPAPGSPLGAAPAAMNAGHPRSPRTAAPYRPRQQFPLTLRSRVPCRISWASRRIERRIAAVSRMLFEWAEIAAHAPGRSTCAGGLRYVSAPFQGDARGWRASSTSRRSAAR